MSAFNSDIHLEETFKKWFEKYTFSTIIETGTHKGVTTNFFSTFNSDVYTIDKQDHRPVLAKKINKIMGNSWEELDKLLPVVRHPLFLFLDAHWSLPTPTPLELEIIAKHKIKPFIWIHDVRVPNQPHLGYDKYKDFIYNEEYIDPYLKNIYGKKYTITYNSVAVGSKRGCMMVIPS